MDLVRTVLLYMMMLVNTATSVSPAITPMPASALPTPTPYVTQAPTAVPTARPATPRATKYTTLYVGDKGNAVRALQNRLKELGYLSGNADGNYGTQTKTAVENFQRANGLKVDGIAGRNTQQIMFESENVVYARAATPVPTRKPVTPTPIIPAVVTVNYMDADTGALIRQTAVQCYADTNVYADATMVPASYRLISNSYVSIRVSNSQALPATVTFYYQRSRTATPNTGVSVPVYYLDSTNLIIARETRMIYQSGAVAADTSLIPAGYTLSGSSVVYVTLSGATASPNPILFRLNRNQVTPTPAPISGVVVPVNYVNAVTGRVFASQNLTLYGTTTIYPQASLVPSGYTLISASYVTVAVANGRANPSSISFTYQPYQPTAAPVIGVTVPVNYVDASTNRVIFSTSVTLVNSALVYADLALVPGYNLSSASSVYVTVRNGQASPGVVTFMVIKAATPTPGITQVAVPVRYMYGSQLIASDTVYLKVGKTSTITANKDIYSSAYTIDGDSKISVTVSKAGAAKPSIVTFYLKPKATPTPVPAFFVSVPVHYQYGTKVVKSTTVSIQNGTTVDVFADPSVYDSSKYDLTGDTSVRVKVSAAGKASPSTVTFYVVPKAPTEAPIYQVPVTVRYMYGETLIASYQEMCATNATTTIYANPAYFEGFIIQGDSWVNVKVNAKGTAKPSTVTFYLVPVAPQPTEDPGFDVPVTVEYHDGNQLVYSTVVYLKSGRKTKVKADSSIYKKYYTLDGSSTVTVNVKSDGTANPNPVIFYLIPIVITPTPKPVKPTPVPSSAPPSGNKNQTLNYQEYSWSASYPVYQGPGEDYFRQSNAKFGGGKTRIYGTDGEWLLIGYGTSKGDYHIGYIHDYKLPSKAKNVQPVVYAGLSATVKSSTIVTTDPVSNMKKLETLPKGTKVTFLAWASSKHRYALIEYESPSYSQLVRAFVKGDDLKIK